MYSHVPKKKKRSKLDVKSRLCYLIGYGFHGYRALDPEQRKVIVCNDVVVEELPVKQNIHPEVYTNDHFVSDCLPTVGSGNRKINSKMRKI